MSEFLAYAEPHLPGVLVDEYLTTQLHARYVRRVLCEWVGVYVSVCVCTSVYVRERESACVHV